MVLIFLVILCLTILHELILGSSLCLIRRMIFILAALYSENKEYGSSAAEDVADYFGTERAWKRIRDRYAAKHPFCEECQRKELLRPVEEVYRKRPLAEKVIGRKSNKDGITCLCIIS